MFLRALRTLILSGLLLGMFGRGPALAAVAPFGASSPAGMPGAGGATAAYEYDPFGDALGATGHAAARNPFRFSTTFQDPVTRHSYYGYRFYDPANGRWLSRDPIGEAGGLNLYGFVGNDPVNAVDVLGMSTASVAVPWSFMEAGASQSGRAAWLSRAAPVASGVAIPIAVGAAAVSIEIAGFNAVHEHMALQVCKRNSCFEATQLFVVGMRAISSILSTQALIAEQQNRPEEGSALNQLSVALDIMDRALGFLREHCPDEFAQYQALKEQANVAAQKAEGGRLLSSAQGAASGGGPRTGARLVDTDISRFVQIRSQLGIGGKRNIAFGEGHVDGRDIGEILGVSSRNTPGALMPENRIFKTIVDGHPRDLDAEVFVLENLARQLSPSSRGTVRLVSELPFCESCSGVIKQFNEMFPNVNLILRSGQ